MRGNDAASVGSQVKYRKKPWVDSSWDGGSNVWPPRPKRRSTYIKLRLVSLLVFCPPRAVQHTLLRAMYNASHFMLDKDHQGVFPVIFNIFSVYCADPGAGRAPSTVSWHPLITENRY